MTRTSTRTSRKASIARPSANVPAQAPAAEETRADIYQRITDRIAAEWIEPCAEMPKRADRLRIIHRAHQFVSLREGGLCKGGLRRYRCCCSGDGRC